jgi:hypothetical protein
MMKSEYQKRAYDHYRWAQRYTKYGDHEKAKAHMQRALHYGKSMGFGTGPDGPDRTGSAGIARSSGSSVSAERPEETKRQRTSSDDSSSRTGSATGGPSGKTDIVFILGPLNASAVEKIKKSIQDSKDAGNKVEVYMQAFTEPDPEGVINAPNLLPMNFNQYSSDDPNVLVDIINENQPNKNVAFYIFPTQTTKNRYFWSKKAQAAFVSGLEKQVDKIDASILTSIVTWLKKDEDIGKGGQEYDLKDKNFAGLIDYARDPDKIEKLVQKLQNALRDTSDDIETESKAVLPIFDPFCAFCAAHYIEGNEAKFSKVPGSHKLVTRRVVVVKNTKPTQDERNKDGIAESPFDRPRFEYTDLPTNCFVVTWGFEGSTPDTLKAAAGEDGIAYIKGLWSSFINGGSASQGRRIVNRILIVQDYYDYDNKMSVWYILHAFNAKVIELYSVTRPVAEKQVMRAMREKKGAFAAAGGFFPPKPSALSDEAIYEWRSEEGPTYPVASPVFTQKNFDPGDVKVDGEPLTLERFKQALAMTGEREAESEAESEQIAYTWYEFISNMFNNGHAGSTSVTWAVTNGGYTKRHGLNPALHTIIEDWYTSVPGDFRPYVAIGKTISARTQLLHAAARA